MPNGEPIGPFQFHDDGADYGFENVDEDTIRVRVAGEKVGATFDLTVLGAQRFSMQLGSAITAAIHRKGRRNNGA